MLHSNARVDMQKVSASRIYIAVSAVCIYKVLELEKNNLITFRMQINLSFDQILTSTQVCKQVVDS